MIWKGFITTVLKHSCSYCCSRFSATISPNFYSSPYANCQIQQTL